MAPSKRPARRPVPQEGDEEMTQPSEVEDDAEEERPAPSQKASGNGDTRIRGGWTESDKQDAASSNYAQALRLEEKSVILKFLDDTPYAAFRRHWIERNTKEGKQLRAWTCLATVDKECPLCEVGDRAQAVSSFNVAIVGDDGQLLLKSWDVGPRLKGVLKGYANDPKIGPLTKGFYIASKTGKRGTVQHNVSPVSKTALLEDYDIDPPPQSEFDRLTKYSPDIIEIPATKTLRELAEEIADEYE